MLANKHLYAEIEVLETAYKGLTDPFQKSMLKSQILMLKLLHNIRTNQVSIMVAEGVALKESEKKEVLPDGDQS